LGPSVSSDGKTLAASRPEWRGAFWTAGTEGGRVAVRRLTPEEHLNPFTTFDAAKDGSIIYVAPKDRFPLWMMGADGSGRRPITSVQGRAFIARCLPDGGIVLAQYGEDLIAHLWRMDAGGSNLRQLTSSSGESIVDVSPDGRTVLFDDAAHPDELWALPEGSRPVRIATSYNWAFFSPDGSRIAYAFSQQSGGRRRPVCNIIPAAGGAPVASFPLPLEGSDHQWAPDGKSLTFVDGANVFRQGLDGTKPVPLTHFTEGVVAGHGWSPDGKLVAIRRRIGDLVNLWTAAADGSDPVQWTDFKTGKVFSMTWARDSRRVVFTYGEAGMDVLLIQNFR
jgi:Tol biopolymer transport system component